VREIRSIPTSYIPSESYTDAVLDSASYHGLLVHATAHLATLQGKKASDTAQVVAHKIQAVDLVNEHWKNVGRLINSAMVGYSL